MKTVILVIAFLSSLLQVGFVWADDPVQVLVSQEIKPDAEGIRRYLRGFYDDRVLNETMAHIRLLGHDEYPLREAATRALLRLPAPPLKHLRQAVDSQNVEVSLRARYILSQYNHSRFAETLHAALNVIEANKIQGLTQEVLSVFPFCKNAITKTAACDALKVIATKEDADLLRRFIRSPDKQIQLAAFFAFADALGEEAQDRIRSFLDGPDKTLRLAAAEIQANRGDRQTLPYLLALLQSSEVRSRMRAQQILRALTGKRFGLVAYASPQQRNKTIAAWKQWIENEGDQADLKFPLDLRPWKLGRTLICVQSQHKVIELGRGGKPTWTQSGPKLPWGCQGLPNGHRLVASFGNREVYEYDEAGKVVWRETGLPGGPTSIQRLENGNTLVACSDSDMIYEFRPDGGDAKSFRVGGRPFCLQRLFNGRTLVTLHTAKRVIEVDSRGREVWALSAKLLDPQSARRLPNGNTLVTDHATKKVLEFDRERKLVWSYRMPANVFDAQRLESGNTLVVDATGVYEISPKGEKVWQFTQDGVSRVHRF